MKKSILLLFLAGTAVSGFAQEVTSVMFSRPVSSAHGVQLTTAEMDRMHQFYESRHAHTGAAKTTTGTYHDWYNMWGQNYTSGTSVGYYFATYPDSNVIDNSGTSPYHMYTHGMGMSFDPTDSAYFSVAVNGGALVTPVGAAIPPNQPYTIDSFFTPVRYMRNNPSTTVVDSLVIELVVTQITNASPTSTPPGVDSGAYSLKVSTANPVFFPVCYDETPRWGTIHYNGGYGNVFGAPYTGAPYVNDAYFDSVFTTKYRYVVPMTDANKNDTDAFGNWNVCQTCTPHQATLPLSPIFNMSGNQRQHLVSFVSFKSGTAYSLGTSSTAANWIKLFAGEPAGSTVWWMQSSGNTSTGYIGSFQDGIIAQNQVRYNDTGFCTVSGLRHNTLIPAFAFSNPPGFDVTEHSFHINWTGTPLGVTNVNNNNISEVNAYPNPARTELNITFANKLNANVTVSLTNIVGQVVASQTSTDSKVTFNTATLANGVYIFAIESDGQRTTGRVVIAH